MRAGKFGPPGWQDAPEWRGWWGDNPPFHTPTYVLTHHARPPAGDGGRYDLPLPRRRAGRRTRRRSGGRRRPGRPYRGWPDDAPRVSRRRAGRPPARRAGPDPPRSRCAVVGRVGGVGAAVRGGGGADAQRGHPSHLHPVRLRSGGVESVGSGVVDEEVGAVEVAPEVDPRPGLSDVPVVVGLDAVMSPRHGAVVPDAGGSALGPEHCEQALHLAQRSVYLGERRADVLQSLVLVDVVQDAVGVAEDVRKGSSAWSHWS